MEHSIWLAAPAGPPASALGDFAALLARIESALEPVDGYGLRWPVWQFLASAAATGRFALHGTGAEWIAEFEAQQSNDIDDFGNRQGVYATADALWAMYFAVVDRPNVSSLINTCFSVRRPDGSYESGPWYYFSVASADPAPWRDGAVYLLPGATFERQGDVVRKGQRIRSAQLFSPQPVRPLARIPVRPDDFPLLDAIRRHEWSVIEARAAADPDGFPWVEA